MIKRFGTPPKSGIHYQLRPGAYAVLIRKDRVLLTFQESPIPEFQLPGGGIDPGEHMIAALHREVMEETGWSIASPLRLGAFRQFVYMPEYDKWAEKICHIFLARPVLKISEPIEKGHHCHWATLNEAVDLVYSEAGKGFLKQVSKF